MEDLKYIFANINDWLKFGETKNLTLVTFNAAIIIGIFQINFGTHDCLQNTIYYVIVPPLFIAAIISLISLSPILSKIKKQKNERSLSNFVANIIDDENVFKNLYYFGYLRTLSKEEFVNEYLSKNVSANKDPLNEFQKELVDQILYNSRITWLKYRFFKYGIFLTSTALIVGSFIIVFSKLLGYWK